MQLQILFFFRIKHYNKYFGLSTSTDAIRDDTHKYGELSGVQLTLERLLIGIEVDKSLSQSGDLVLVVERHSPTHVPLTSAEELDGGPPAQASAA